MLCPPCMPKTLHRLPIPAPNSPSSQVGHNALGAGQIVDQGAKCVDKALATGWEFKAFGAGTAAASTACRKVAGRRNGSRRCAGRSKCSSCFAPLRYSCTQV